MLELTGEVGDNGVDVQRVGHVDVLDGGREVSGDTLLLLIVGVSGEYRVHTEMRSYRPKTRTKYAHCLV